MNRAMLVSPSDLSVSSQHVIVDCRFNLADKGEGERLYLEGHVAGAVYLDLERHLSAPVAEHGGRHPLPVPADFIATLASVGIGPDTEVVAYDANRLAYATRLWWMMRSIGYRAPRLLDGGYGAWVEADGAIEAGASSSEPAVPGRGAFTGACDIDGLREAQSDGAILVDSREERRYQGLEEPIDPVAGHIPGAVNHPWQGVTDASGRVRDQAQLRAHWGDTLEAEKLVVYCGSGVTACVNLFSLALLGRDDATLYAGSWSDWCSYL
ncbi:sulfurtransferase [Halioglobus maricola]|nr:sulfurtransferase [Halioglobus maricola]